eukprot:gene53-biopygen6049
MLCGPQAPGRPGIPQNQVSQRSGKQVPGSCSGAGNTPANRLEHSLEASALKHSRGFRIIRFGHGPGSEWPKRAAESPKPHTFLWIPGVL